ncbi:MAG TPA: ATP cone domain-containing protein [Pelolinea sp.]|nr:ATP cone domain-containing protein [Pelolinea sp.]
MTRFDYVIKRSGVKVPFTPQRITNAIYRAAVAVGGRDRETAEKLTIKVIQNLEKSLPDGHIPHVEEVQDAVEKILIENAHAKVAKAFILYRDERARMRAQRETQTFQSSQNIPWAKIWQVLDWASSHDVHTIEKYNQRIKKGELQQVTSEAEIFYEEDIKNASEKICERREDLRIVLISGPSSSGKTTTTIKIGENLKQMGLSLVALNVDNYFFDLDKHPKDEFGDYDFETPQALDLRLINDHLTKLVRGEEIKIPFYDFKNGRRHDNQTPMKIGKNDIILIDSLHGLYPPMTENISEDKKFKLYLEPLMQMKDSKGGYVRWTDIRLMRRMLRDEAYRAYDPEKTLTHWHYVRASEIRNIIPNNIYADMIINSAMPYELSIYKSKLFNQFYGWEKKYKDDSLRSDAYERATRIRELLEEIIPLDDDSFVPSDSVIREFIGGSSLSYH